MKKRKNPLRWLLLIPLQLLISALIFCVGILADNAFWSNADAAGMGHPVPVFTLLGTGIAFGLLVIVVIVSIIAAIVSSNRNNKENKMENHE